MGGAAGDETTQPLMEAPRPHLRAHRLFHDRARKAPGSKHHVNRVTGRENLIARAWVRSTACYKPPTHHVRPILVRVRL